MIATKKRAAEKRKIKWGPYLKRNYDLYLLLLPCVVFVLVFSYVPMYGILLTFKKYMPLEGILGSPWVGFDHFEHFFSNYKFSEILFNTLGTSLYSLVASFPAPILLALALNHLRHNRLCGSGTYHPAGGSDRAVWRESQRHSGGKSQLPYQDV